MDSNILAWCNSDIELSHDISQVVVDIMGKGEVSLDIFISYLTEMVKKETHCFLEPPITPRPSLSERSISSPVASKVPAVPSFEDEFPSLGSAPVPMVQKKKKRIRSTLISSTTSLSQRKVGNIASIPDTSVVNRSTFDAVSSLPDTMAPMFSSRGAFLQASVKPSSFTEASSLQSMPPPSSPMKTRTVSEPVASPMSPRSHLSHQKLVLDEATSAVIETMDMTGKPKVMKRLGRLYGNMIMGQLVNRLQELNFLYRLLCCAHASIVAGSSPLFADNVRFFFCPLDCLVFVTCAFEVASPFIREIDPRVQSLLINDPIFASLCPDFITNMISSVAKKSASLISGQRVRVGKVSGKRGVALPFREETDSRHHFRSQEQSRLFVNREACRDLFLKLYTTFRDVRREFDDKKATKFTEEFPTEVANVLNLMQPANAQWFASLIVDHLSATSLDVENDADVHVAFAGADPKKLENLSQRMSSKPLSASSALRPQSQGDTSNRHNASSSSSNINQSKVPFSLNNMLGEPSELFVSSGESFFFKFLSIMNDHHLLRHIHGLLVLRLTSVTEGWLNRMETSRSCSSSSNKSSSSGGSGSSSGSGSVESSVLGIDRMASFENTDIDDDTIDSLVSLRVLARFLGMISFRPYWNLSAIAAQAHSVALNTAVEDATKVETALSSPPPLKPHSLLKRAINCGMLVLVVPWMVEYLRMLKWDIVMRKTPYFEDIVLTLRKLHYGLLSLPSLNDNRTLVSIELELLFADLELLSPLPSKSSIALSKECLFNKTDIIGIDQSSLVAQRIYSRHLCLGVEEFLNGLLTSRKAFQNAASSSIAKKVRPHFISSYNLYGGGQDKGLRMSGVSGMSSPLSLSRTTTESGQPSDLQLQMQVSFFQRYPELQSIADFVVNLVLKNCGDLALKQCEMTDLTVWMNEGSRGALRLAKQLSRFIVEAQAPHVVTQTMSLLAPPNLPEQVKQVAIKLTLKQVQSVGISVVVDAILPGVRRALSQSLLVVNDLPPQPPPPPQQQTDQGHTISVLPQQKHIHNLPLLSLDKLISILTSDSFSFVEPSSSQDAASFIVKSVAVAVRMITIESESQHPEPLHVSLETVLPVTLQGLYHRYYSKQERKPSTMLSDIYQLVLGRKVIDEVAQYSVSTQNRYFQLCSQLVHYRFIEPFQIERRLLTILNTSIQPDSQIGRLTRRFGQHLINSFCSAVPLETLDLHFHQLEECLKECE